ncbi:neuroglian-like [Physella acuta]|uniref:neuroglian-like n=1 Tax=Physella acuta TaxID=109671 RepID=UPI0027DE5965|nr:neuroglian-like [Physella acuta]
MSLPHSLFGLHLYEPHSLFGLPLYEPHSLFGLPLYEPHSLFGLPLYESHSRFAGNVRISEQLRNVVVEEGERAKFVCKVDVHHLDEERLAVTWKVNGQYLSPEDSGRLIHKEEGSRFALIIKKTKLSDTGVYSCIASVGLDTDMSSAHLQIKSAPDPPINVKVTSCHGNSAGLSWDEGNSNGAEIQGYTIQFNTSDHPDLWYDYDEQFDSSFRAATLQLYPYGSYSFRVKARNAMGSSKPSATPSRMCTTPPDRPDRNPSNVRTRTDTKKTLVVEWTPMSRLYFHGPRFRYQVKWRLKGTFTWDSAYVTDPNQGFLDIETNDVYNVYEIQVKAENSMGEAHQPAFIYLGHSGESEPLVAPSNFSLNPEYHIEPHTAHFIWDAVDTATEQICGKFKGYKLRYWKSSEGWNKKKEVEIVIGDELRTHGPRIKVALSDLPAYTALRAQVAVMNAHYTGPFSELLDFFTPEGVPSAVRDLRVHAFGVAYVLLKWKPPQHPNGILLGYDIAYQQVSGLELGPIRPLMPHINDPLTLGARITGLQSGHRYRFIVWARTKQGRGEPSFNDMITAKGQIPNPPKVQVSELSNSSVNITWMSDQASRDVKYLVEYRQSGHQDWHNTDYVYDKSWLMLDKSNVPVADLEVRLVASNRMGDTATSKTIAVAKSLHTANKTDKKKVKNSSSACSSNFLLVALALVPFSLSNLVFLR